MSSLDQLEAITHREDACLKIVIGPNGVDVLWRMPGVRPTRVQSLEREPLMGVLDELLKRLGYDGVPPESTSWISRMTPTQRARALAISHELTAIRHEVLRPTAAHELEPTLGSSLDGREFQEPKR